MLPVSCGSGPLSCAADTDGWVRRPPREVQKVVNPSKPITADRVHLETLLQQFGLETLLNIDPNPINFVGVGILHSTKAQIGCLLRIEPNRDAQAYRVTLRTSNEAASMHLCTLLAAQL